MLRLLRLLVNILVFFSLLFIVHVDVAVLAHSSSVEFLVRAVPGLFSASIFVITVVAHSLRIVSFIIVATFDRLFSKYKL